MQAKLEAPNRGSVRVRRGVYDAVHGAPPGLLPLSEANLNQRQRLVDAAECRFHCSRRNAPGWQFQRVV